MPRVSPPARPPHAFERQPLAAGVALLVAIVALYARAFGRGFASEDFLLVRFLHEHPPWNDLAGLLTRPWLGIAGIGFFRPVSTLLYGVEIAAFGPHSRGYVVAHLLVHALAALLVWAIALELVRRLPAPTGGAGAAWLAGLLFAVYPLHPNAVVFTASFATLFGGVLALLAFHLYQRFRADQRLRWWIASLAAFGLALGSYEATVVTPLWLAAYDHGLVGAQGRRQRTLLRGWTPFVGVLVSYFAWRLHLFGGFVGGYPEARQRLLAPASIGSDLLASLHLLHLPLYARPPALATTILTPLLLLGVPVALFVASRRARGAAPAWALGWVVTLSAMAPFAFHPVVPANGRYWYLAAAGAAISLAFLTSALAASLGAGARRALPWIAAGLFAAFWMVELAGHAGNMRRAADLARTVQAELLRAGRVSPRPPRIFVTGHPEFLTGPAGVNLAQVLRYGLRDSVGPPFVAPRLPVWPLPPLAGAELVPVLLGAPPGRVLAWDAVAARMRDVAAVPAAAITELEPLTADSSDTMAGPGSVAVRVPAGPYQRFRLLLSAPINGTVVDLGLGERRGEVLRATLPADFLLTSTRLYDGPIFWWIEARDAGGRLTGFTRMRPLERRVELTPP